PEQGPSLRRCRRQRLCKRCAVSARKKTFVRSLCLSHKLGYQPLKAWIAAQGVEPRVCFQAVGVSADLDPAFFVGCLEKLQRFLFFAQGQIDQGDWITLNKLMLPASQKFVKNSSSFTGSTHLRINPRHHCFSDRGLREAGRFLVQR